MFKKKIVNKKGERDYQVNQLIHKGEPIGEREPNMNQNNHYRRIDEVDES